MPSDPRGPSGSPRLSPSGSAARRPGGGVRKNAAPAVPAKVEFNRDVRPILSDNCFLCHGPDKNRRKADLRLDIREEALKAEAIVPGKPDESELIARIFSADPDD